MYFRNFPSPYSTTLSVAMRTLTVCGNISCIYFTSSEIPINEDQIFLIKVISKNPHVLGEERALKMRPFYSAWFMFQANCFSLKHQHVLISSRAQIIATLCRGCCPQTFCSKEREEEMKLTSEMPKPPLRQKVCQTSSWIWNQRNA